MTDPPNPSAMSPFPNTFGRVRLSPAARAFRTALDRPGGLERIVYDLEAAINPAATLDDIATLTNDAMDRLAVSLADTFGPDEQAVIVRAVFGGPTDGK